MVEIMQCTCRNEYQDTVYGKGNRVHNYAMKPKSWRCTVCGQVQQGSKKKEDTKDLKKEVRKGKSAKSKGRK